MTKNDFAIIKLKQTKILLFLWYDIINFYKVIISQVDVETFLRAFLFSFGSFVIKSFQKLRFDASNFCIIFSKWSSKILYYDLKKNLLKFCYKNRICIPSTPVFFLENLPLYFAL